MDKSARKPLLVSMIIIALICIIVQQQSKINQIRGQVNWVTHLYQEHNNRQFEQWVLLEKSFIPLAETLEELSGVKDDKNHVLVQGLIEKAKGQSGDWDNYMSHLFGLSKEIRPDSLSGMMINETVWPSEKHEDQLYEGLQFQIYYVIYGVSYDYWKSKPKSINAETRNTLRAIAAELRNMEEAMEQIREQAAWIRSNPKMHTEHVKALLLYEIKPYLDNLKDIQNNFNNRYIPAIPAI